MTSLPPSALSLDILECSCVCGNRWTHSRPILMCADGGYGGTPTPEQEHRFAVERTYSTRRQYDHCFRCVGLMVHRESWQAPAAPLAATSIGDPLGPEALGYKPRTRPSSRLVAHRKRLTTEALDDEIFK